MATVTGDEFDNDLDGTGNPDTIQAKEGNDILRGKAGADELNAGTGDDTLLGGTGADTLKDGFGTDRLTGGKGADVFEFVRLEGLGGPEKDLVLDFNDGIDLLNVAQITADPEDFRVRDMASGDVRISFGDRIIILKDHDGTLDAADITLADFLV